MSRDTRSGHTPDPLRSPAHRTAALTAPPTGGTAGRAWRTGVRLTATAAALATVATVVVVTSRDEAVAVDPVPLAYELRGSTVSAAHPADVLRATSVLAADDERRRAALDAMARAQAQARAEAAEKARVVAANRAARTKAAALAAARKAEAARQARLEAAGRARAAAVQQAARSAARSAARDPRGVARAMLGSYGWGSGQFSCLDALWTKESGWNLHADNPSSSAYGIPQALPGSKMASAGPDWRNNPVTQIRWGLGYIRSTYGSPCAAWSHSQAHNWY